LVTVVRAKEKLRATDVAIALRPAPRTWAVLRALAPALALAVMLPVPPLTLALAWLCALELLLALAPPDPAVVADAFAPDDALAVAFTDAAVEPWVKTLATAMLKDRAMVTVRVKALVTIVWTIEKLRAIDFAMAVMPLPLTFVMLRAIERLLEIEFVVPLLVVWLLLIDELLAMDLLTLCRFPVAPVTLTLELAFARLPALVLTPPVPELARLCALALLPALALPVPPVAVAELEERAPLLADEVPDPEPALALLFALELLLALAEPPDPEPLPPDEPWPLPPDLLLSSPPAPLPDAPVWLFDCWSPFVSPFLSVPLADFSWWPPLEPPAPAS